MSNPNNLPTTADDILSGIANMREADRVDTTSGTIFMKFAKGSFTYGAEGVDIEPDSRWAVLPQSFIHGYQAWGAGELLGEQTATMKEKPINRLSLPALTFTNPKTKLEEKASWNPIRGFHVACISGEDEGLQCYLSGSSKGFNTAAKELLKELFAQLNDDPSKPVPIIEFGVDDYKHKTWGKIYTPEFNVVDWVEMSAVSVDADEPEEGDDDGPDVEPGEEPEGEEPEGEEHIEEATIVEPEPKAKPRRGRKPTAADAGPKPDANGPPASTRRQRQRS